MDNVNQIKIRLIDQHPLTGTFLLFKLLFQVKKRYTRGYYLSILSGNKAKGL